MFVMSIWEQVLPTWNVMPEARMWMHVGKTDVKKGMAKNAAGSTRITRNTVPHSRVGRKAFATDMTTVGKTTQYAAIRHGDGSSFLHWRNRSLTYSTLQGSVQAICFGSKLIYLSLLLLEEFWTRFTRLTGLFLARPTDPPVSSVSSWWRSRTFSREKRIISPVPRMRV